MRILIGIHYFPPHVGGMEIVAKTQAEQLVKNGQNVTVLTSSAAARQGRRKENGYTLLRIPVWNFFERQMGVPFPFFSPSLLTEGWREVKRADIVHLHDVFYQTSFVLALFAWLQKKPVVVTQHVDMIPHPNALVRFVQWLVYRTTGYFVLRASFRIAVLNSNVQRFLMKLGIPKNKIIFMPNGVDFATFHPRDSVDIRKIRQHYKLPADQPVALFVGRFVPKKGFHKLIQATSDSYHLAFAGGEAPNGVEPDSRRTFLGSLTPSQLAELYNAVDIFILPSEGEGFPLTVQEAMASQLPIVISHNPGYDIYQLDPDLLLQIRPTVEIIRQTLTQLTGDARRRKKMGAYAYQYATDHFSWEKNTDELLRLYKEAQS